MDVLSYPSPNFGPRRDGAAADLIVLHYTAMDSANAALNRLCSPEFEVSAHYLISEVGVIYQLVAEDMRAWHAGAGSWGAVTDINSASIGVELANDGHTPFAETQMSALEELLADIQQRRSIAPHRLIGHSDMAPRRKTDPGGKFDWRRLALQRLSIWPEPGEVKPDAAKFQKAAQQFGYGASLSLEALLSALRLRFRPWAVGPLSASDMAAILDLARRYPVDPVEPLG